MNIWLSTMVFIGGFNIASNHTAHLMSIRLYVCWCVCVCMYVHCLCMTRVFFFAQPMLQHANTYENKSERNKLCENRMHAYIIHISMIMCYCPWHTAIYSFIRWSHSIIHFFLPLHPVYLIRITLTLHAKIILELSVFEIIQPIYEMDWKPPTCNINGHLTGQHR